MAVQVQCALAVEHENKRFLAVSGVRRGVVLGLICLGTVSVRAQIQDLATNDDGSKLYFSSILLLKGADEYSNGKIFEYANGSYTLIRQTTPSVTLADGSAFQFAFRMPSVSGDGSILAYDGTSSCFGGQSCRGATTVRGFIIGAQLSVGWGSLRVSHNGRYALNFGGLSPGLQQHTWLYDFQSGRYLTDVAGTVLGDGRQSVADDGTVITAQGLWRNGQIKALSLAQPFNLRLSADGSVVVYESATEVQQCTTVPPGCTVTPVLRAYNVATGADIQLAKGLSIGQSRYGPQQSYFFPTISNDGRLVLYSAPDLRTGTSQLFLSTTDGSSQRKLIDGIGEALLSGDAIALTPSARAACYRSTSIRAKSRRSFPAACPSFTVHRMRPTGRQERLCQDHGQPSAAQPCSPPTVKAGSASALFSLRCSRQRRTL
jgi:hypothetical protein